jgi:hypothetical protein
MKRHNRLQVVQVAAALAVTTVLATGFAMGVASAQTDDGGASCSILEIEAANSGAPSIDAALGAELVRKLKKPPFSSWNTFKVFGSQTQVLLSNRVETLALKQGKLGLLLLASTKPRVRLGVTLDGSDGKRVLDTKVAVDAGDWIAVGRSLKGDRGQIIAFKCTLR